MKDWKIEKEGGMSFLFDNKPQKFYTRKEAEEHMKKHLPRGGIVSQAVHHKLFERNGFFRWKLRGCYIRDTRYYTEDDKDLAEPLDGVVMACKHVKEHLDKCGKTCNQMFGIRASWLHNFCPKHCELNPFN